MFTDTYPGIRVEDGIPRKITDEVIREDRFSLYLNNVHIMDQIASNDMVRELGAGFFICEGLCDTVESVKVEGTDIWVEADAREDVTLEMRTGGGHGIHQSKPGTIASSLTIPPEEVYAATAQIMSDTWQKTGGVHCSVLLKDGTVVAKSCDIGRHNTVDKVVGAAELERTDRSLCYIGCTGRQPSGMVGKVANAGIPILISRAAPTNKGIDLAEKTGITLINFSRERRFTIFAHPERISGINDKLTDKPDGNTHE
ncbi:formate dehydrogenase accessory sulfurtransferase FdhD [Methanogenium organophilum]|uniref:Formate dehydrogenase accessory sulfurtransferase FdhD n=1 Tax=Methanogenium organophilum TaxID=2199 RepID=A0A9X9S3X1_METOG|nr:formate dehydrogenase accessory sulfurtransferase FdhD [Methanogenium organophilum]WAI01323.1 formate dehydrogenase accessory sulfurtransferase FdhD [Methanogenium organophilum]